MWLSGCSFVLLNIQNSHLNPPLSLSLSLSLSLYIYIYIYIARYVYLLTMQYVLIMLTKNGPLGGVCLCVWKLLFSLSRWGEADTWFSGVCLCVRKTPCRGNKKVKRSFLEVTSDWLIAFHLWAARIIFSDMFRRRLR